jgi:2-polyprenyl-6-methoxyphenol hydroxylase-like FAD-dependent oxidoreductase
MIEQGNTPVLIDGWRPAGLVPAIDLGQRGIDCIVVEQAATTSNQPNANPSSARTMEDYRRLGFADEVRAEGLPPDHSLPRVGIRYISIRNQYPIVCDGSRSAVRHKSGMKGHRISLKAANPVSPPTDGVLAGRATDGDESADQGKWN